MCRPGRVETPSDRVIKKPRGGGKSASSGVGIRPSGFSQRSAATKLVLIESRYSLVSQRSVDLLFRKIIIVAHNGDNYDNAGISMVTTRECCMRD